MRMRPSPFSVVVPAVLLCAASLMGGQEAAAQMPELANGEEFHAGDCYATLSAGTLTVGNSHIRRTWTLLHGSLVPASFTDLDTHHEWLPLSPSPATHASSTTEDGPALHGASGRFGATEEPSLRLELLLASTRYEFQIFPEVRGVRMWTESGASTHTASEIDPRTLEKISLHDQHLRLIAVELHDRTDAHNELATEREWLLHPSEQSLSLLGNLFFVEDTLSQNGFLLLKESPEPDSRPVQISADLELTSSKSAAMQLTLLGVPAGPSGVSHKWTMLSYSGGSVGRTRALHDLQRALRPYSPTRDGLLLSNTWGDRADTSKINADFVRKEIDAGQKIGLEVMQVDDGWQIGSTPQLLKVGGAYEANPHFWQVNEQRLPDGIAPLSEYAHSHGMKLGLWFAPDSEHDFATWQQDSQKVLTWHQKGGVDAFKFDMIQLKSSKAEERFNSMLGMLQSETRGNVIVDLDVTAGNRLGYWGNIPAGNIFVENRYTDWHNYWPHQTLRNLWQLSHYIDPLRLRVEFLNSERNTGLYAEDPLAPAAYSPACLFAITMFASPLAWFETTGLSPQYIASVKPVIDRWKLERESIYRGLTVPIGAAPDGIAWTGFASVNNGGGYLLVFRERNTQSTWAVPSGLFSASVRPVILSGKGSIHRTGAGLQVSIPDSLGYLFIKLSADQKPNKIK